VGSQSKAAVFLLALTIDGRSLQHLPYGDPIPFVFQKIVSILDALLAGQRPVFDQEAFVVRAIIEEFAY
jgi:hypothetical protein